MSLSFAIPYLVTSVAWGVIGSKFDLTLPEAIASGFIVSMIVACLSKIAFKD